jgi:hypothetical protein
MEDRTAGALTIFPLQQAVQQAQQVQQVQPVAQVWPARRISTPPISSGALRDGSCQMTP